MQNYVQSVNKKKAILYGMSFFFLMRVFTPEFINENAILNLLYVSISEILTIWNVFNFCYKVGRKDHCYTSQISLIIVVIIYYLYMLFITFCEDGNIRRMLMMAYPTIGSLCFLHNHVEKRFKELLVGISWMFEFFTVLNFVDMVFVRHAYRMDQDTFLVGGKNQMAIFLALSLCFYFADKLNEEKRIKFSIRDYIFMLIIICSTLFSNSSTCIITMFIVFTMLFASEFRKKGLVINIKLITIVYIIVWFMLIVFRMQYLVSPLVHNVFHKDLTFSHRTIIWDTALQEISKKPFVGYGITDSGDVFHVHHDYTGGNNNVWANMSAHNEILQLLYYGGIILVILFFLIYLVALNLKKGEHYNKKFFIFFLSIIAILINWLSEVPGEYTMIFVLAMCYYSKRIKCNYE
ncbi:O-antigen ligase [uncultured Eubacterium sp.]|uniref:O-antigen ligase family protein n=1 Tax=uncultured Eubacterium sp. TaxID=165185 RepID=UPI0025F7AD64|nr:O-antigen ligase family protein [uncultured Eubacterium sp.]